MITEPYARKRNESGRVLVLVLGGSYFELSHFISCSHVFIYGSGRMSSTFLSAAVPFGSSTLCHLCLSAFQFPFPCLIFIGILPGLRFHLSYL